MSLSGFIYTFAVTSLAVSLVMETAEGSEGAVDRVMSKVVCKANTAALTVLDAAQDTLWMASIQSDSLGQPSR